LLHTRTSRREMDGSVFTHRIAPLLAPETLRALRLASRRWNWVVDELVVVKGAFGLRGRERMTVADVRFSHAVGFSVDSTTALLACAGGDLNDLTWALKVFLAAASLCPWEQICQRVVQVDCMDYLIRTHGLSSTTALRCSCISGHLELAQWTAAAFNITAGDLTADAKDEMLRLSQASGHSHITRWLSTQLFSESKVGVGEKGGGGGGVWGVGVGVCGCVCVSVCVCVCVCVCLCVCVCV
jgi:hypothetical protein